MPALAITVRVLSGRELQIMAEPSQLVSTLRQRVEEEIGSGEFQEVKFYMGFHELCYDMSVGESGVLDSIVQAVLVTNVCKAKKVIKNFTASCKKPPPPLPRNLQPWLQPFSFPTASRKKAPLLLPRHLPLSLQPFSFPTEALDPGIESQMERECVLALNVLEEMDSDAEDTRKLIQDLETCGRLSVLYLAPLGSRSGRSKWVLQRLSGFLERGEHIVDTESAVWMKLIESLAPYDEDHAQNILCALASVHTAAAVRAAAVQAFGFAPIWAVSHIRNWSRVAWSIDADPDEIVREAAAASVQSLKDAQAHGRLPPAPPAVRPVAPELRRPPPPATVPPARRDVEDVLGVDEAKRKQQDELRKSKEEDLQMEQQALQEAFLRSKADAWSADGIILSRLTFHSPSVTSCLLESNDLASCRSRVEGAGCSLQPAWANGALLLVPVTEQQIMEADIDLQAHNILILASDEQLVKEALAQLARRKRPVLKPEHYPHGKLQHAPMESKGSAVEMQQQNSEECQVANTMVTRLPGSDQLRGEAHLVAAWMQGVGIVVERTFLSFPMEKDISEASTVIHSAPADGNASSGQMNPHV